MPTRLIPDGTNSSSMKMEDLSVRRITMPFNSQELTLRIDRSTDLERTTTNSNNGTFAM